MSHLHWALVGGVVLAAIVPSAANASLASTRTAAQPSLGHLALSAMMPRGNGSVGSAAALAIRRGYLAYDEARYRRAKAAADARVIVPLIRPVSAPHSLAPVVGGVFSGLVDKSFAPSDSTSSVGATRFIELVNSKYAIYSRTSTTPLIAGTLNDLAAGSGQAFDPQIMWDAQTNRFFYAEDLVVSSTQNLLAFGFSKSGSPNNGTTDFCHYNVNYGSNFPDYPKLGDSAFFAIIGANVFGSTNAFLGPDVIGIGKPGSAAITTCPAASSLKFGEGFNLHGAGGAAEFTPVPANEIDNNNVGFVLSVPATLPSTSLFINRVTKDATTGNPVFQGTGTSVTIPSFSVPPSAPQRAGFANSAKTLDTLDGRLTQAVAATDPAHPGTFGLWTQQTTATSPAGRSEVRWYEINAQPTSNALVQRGKASNTAWFGFNGAISPDRQRRGTTVQFGGDMVLNFDTSSTMLFPAVRMLSKVGTAAQSAPVLLRASVGNYGGFDCAGTDNRCRWGDYAAASPDPVTTTGATTGQVWGTSMYTSGVDNPLQSNWLTLNFHVAP
jgi:hypothetical protein